MQYILYYTTLENSRIFGIIDNATSCNIYQQKSNRANPRCKACYNVHFDMYPNVPFSPYYLTVDICNF